MTVVRALPIALLTILAIAGCGSAGGNPPPTEPADSPPLAERPAGTVLRLDSEAEGVAVDPRSGLAAISLRDPGRIALIDVATERIVRRVPTGDPARHLALAAPGGPVLAPIEYRDVLLEIALPSGRAASVAVGDFPHDAAALGGRIFVAEEGADTVSIIERGQVAATLPVPEQPGGIAAGAGTVGVVAVAAREITFIDAATLAITGTVTAGAGPSHVVAGPDDGSDRFYVVDTGGAAILVYEGGAEPRLLDRANVPGSPYGIAVDDRRGRLWVTQTALNRVIEMEITELAPKIVASYPTVRQPNAVAVDERSGRVIVVGRAGAVQFLDPGERGGRR